ncbi:alpha/beta hydrolase [Nocardia amamiensis]|uniref:alpha/beta hydrolase n=1 Tax=Nocardia amamiensis TaxID=404578 RepID=UPI0012F4E63E|nr:alpha/beta hydrolase [Nocardia amamiensis]
MIRILARITQDLRGLTSKAMQDWQDIGTAVAGSVVRDVDEKVHLDQRGRHEIEKAGEGLTAPKRMGECADEVARSGSRPARAEFGSSFPVAGHRPRHLGLSLPEDSPITADERGFAAEAVTKLKDRYGPAANVNRLVSRIEPDEVVTASRARATQNARWWDTLSEHERSAMVRVRPHLIGNTDGIPYAVRDRANRLSITRDLERYLGQRPTGGQRRSGLTRAELAHLRNIVRTRDHLAIIEHQARAIGARDVQVMAYNPRAYGGNGRVAVSIGDADRAEIVTRHIGGFGTTLRSLEYRSTFVCNEWEVTTRYAGHDRAAAIIDIGYHHPISVVPPEPAKPLFAEVGGYVVARDVASYNATREATSNLPNGAVTPRLHTLLGHSYGSTTVCYAGDGGRLAGEIDQVVLSGSPGAGPLTHAADFGIGTENVYVLAAHRDPITALGAETTAGQGRFLGTGLGLDPANARFDAIRVAAEPPHTPAFGSRLQIHQGYNSFADPQTREPTEALHNIGLIASGRGDEAVRVVHRPAVDTPTLRHRIGTLPVDPEQTRVARRPQ